MYFEQAHNKLSMLMHAHLLPKVLRENLLTQAENLCLQWRNWAQNTLEFTI